MNQKIFFRIFFFNKHGMAKRQEEQRAESVLTGQKTKASLKVSVMSWWWNHVKAYI